MRIPLLENIIIGAVIHHEMSFPASFEDRSEAIVDIADLRHVV